MPKIKRSLERQADARRKLQELVDVYGSQARLADALGAYQTNVSRWLSGTPISSRVCDDIEALYDRVMAPKARAA